MLTGKRAGKEMGSRSSQLRVTGFDFPVQRGMGKEIVRTVNLHGPVYYLQSRLDGLFLCPTPLQDIVLSGQCLPVQGFGMWHQR
ncbi:hypothetical protein SDC9_180381 [bioreactor metagenome]|uniref:Uncharacterized protein n=1 Tax=bioreactor metagenome TaxID=1076179 RepID=A0A645H1K4_9ZZZZ